MRVPWLIPTPYPSLPPAESDHVLLAQRRQVEEVMEKLQQFNRSLGLMLVAVEGAQHHLEKHLQDLHTVLHPAGEPGMGAGGRLGAGGCQHQALAPHSAGWTPSAISTCILHGSCFVLLVVLLVATPSRAILLLLFLASSALGIPVLSTFLAFAVAGGEGPGWKLSTPGFYGLGVLGPLPPSCFPHRAVGVDGHLPQCWGSQDKALSLAHLHPNQVGDG